jgi:transposase
MNYIGIDVSKGTLDMVLLDQGGCTVEHAVVKNTAQAITARIKKWSSTYELDPQDCLTCLEPTGHYSHTALRTLVGAGIPTWMAHPLDIKKCMGMVRDKNDKVDAKRIADHARRHQDRKRLATTDTLAVMELKQLIALRKRMVVDLAKHKVYSTDMLPTMSHALRKHMAPYLRSHSKQCKDMIKKTDAAIMQLINADPIMRTQYELLLTVERVGPRLAAYLIATTERFTRMQDPRKLACHAGVSPHHQSSGSSVRGPARVSHHADKDLKTLLHMAAFGAANGKGELGVYYIRKVQEGKNSYCVFNAIRNKILARACAVIKRGTPFVVKTQACP